MRTKAKRGTCAVRRTIDPEILEESALATAQATIQNAIDSAGISRADLARKMGCPRSFISRMMSGSHNLTVRTFARAMAACGVELWFVPGSNQVQAPPKPSADEATARRIYERLDLDEYGVERDSAVAVMVEEGIQFLADVRQK